MIAYVHNFYNFYKLSVSESSYCFPNFKIIKELFCDSLEKNMKDPEFRKEWAVPRLYTLCALASAMGKKIRIAIV